MPHARSRRIAIGVVAAIVAATCVALGLWQLRRLDERRASNARIVRALGQPAAVVISASEPSDPVAYRPVRASGSYDLGREVIVFGRSLEGSPGHHVVTPLVLEDGSAVLVVRGWVPFRMQEAPVPQARPPTTVVTVEGFLLPPEGDGSTMPDESRAVPVLDVEGIAASLPYEAVPLAMQLRRQMPPQDGLPRPLPEPDLTEGPHLSYAIQWFSFAAVSLVGATVLIVRDRHGQVRS